MKQTRKRLFVDAHSFDGFYQGSRTFIKGIYASLPPGELELFMGARDIRRLREEFPEVPEENLIRYRCAHPLWRLGFEIPRLLRKYQIDYAHFQYVTPVFKPCRYIVTTHDILFRDFKEAFPLSYRLLRNLLFRYSLRHADIRTTPSLYSAGRIALHYRIPLRDLHVIPNGVPEGYFYPRCSKEESRRYIRKRYGLDHFILCVSRIEPRKNQRLLLQAFLDMALYQRDLSLVFIGKGSLGVQSFIRSISALPPEVSQYIRHLSQVREPDLFHFYQAARVMIYPSLAEGFGIPPLEAAALKTPVLCADRTAMSEFIFLKDYLFDPGDPGALQEKLASLLSRAPETRRLEEIATHIRENYRWCESGRRLLEGLANYEAHEKPEKLSKKW